MVHAIVGKTIIFQESLMNMDEELAMINQLEVVCGHNFASKLRDMLDDASLSTELTEKFNLSTQDQPELAGLHFSMRFMKSVWPFRHS